MSASPSPLQGDVLPDRLPFPPLKKSHIRNCAVPSWHARYRTLTPKTRLIPLNSSFISYLRSDGIVLPDDEPHELEWQDGDDDDDDDGDPEEASPVRFDEWADIHAKIRETIKELGGRVYPKLNWSAPKDATWIAAANTMECTSANDVYLLLKSSDFVTHDLQQAYYGCDDDEDDGNDDDKTNEIQYALALRKAVPSMVTSMEFRCFVRRRRLIGICQRDINHYEFMPSLILVLQDLIYDFFNDRLRDTFPDESFVFDVYVPRPREHARVWLIDVNPWAPRTDPLLFSWLELLTRPELPEEPDLASEVVRLQIGAGGVVTAAAAAAVAVEDDEGHVDSGYDTADATEDEQEEEDAIDLSPSYYPEFRVVKRDDPETYSFNTPLYSAHKLPKDIVDASRTIDGEGGMRDFLDNWQQKVAEMEGGAGQESDSD